MAFYRIKVLLLAGFLACLMLEVMGAPASFFFSGGVQHELTPETEWIAVQLRRGPAAKSVEKHLRDRGLVKAEGQSVYHERHRILVLPVARGKRSQAEVEAIPGAQREIRAYSNGGLDPILETDEFVIRFKSDIGRDEVVEVLRAEGAEIVRPLGDYSPNGYLARVISPEQRGALETANALHGRSGVIYSHPNFIWPKASRFMPNDPLYPMQWHLNNVGGAGGVAGADIRVERAWDITRGDPNLIVAILDDGVDMAHEDFATPGKLVNGWDFVGNDNDPQPGSGGHHGTACAGLVAANGNNGIGVSGVAPNCRIMPVRMLGPDHTVEREAAAISHAKNNGADIISNSWGPKDGLGKPQPCPDVVSEAIHDAADKGRGGKGCVIVWAAGNGNESVDLDGYASHPKVICVAASRRDDTRSPYSDFGNAIDICAPGGSRAGDMVTTDRTGLVGYARTNYTAKFNGTSAATPVVSGVAALLLSSEPSLTSREVRLRLIDSSDYIDTANAKYDENGHHVWYGYGRVNAWKALAWKDDIQPSVGITTPSDNLVTDSLPSALGVVSDKGLGILGVQVKVRRRNDGRWWDWGFAVWSSDESRSLLQALVNGDTWSVDLPNLVQGDFELHVRAEDKAGNSSGWVVRRFGLDSAAPVVTILTPVSGMVYPRLTTVSGSAADIGSGVSKVRVSIRNPADGTWWRWRQATWGSTTFSWEENVSIAVGTTAWTQDLPNLPEGSYELFAQAVDNSDKGSAWASHPFVIDVGPPVVGFAPLTDQSKIFDFRDVRGTVSEPAQVSVRFVEFNPGGKDRYWTGTAWDSNGANGATWIATSVTGGTWVPADGTPLPSREQMRYGFYVVEAKAVDRAKTEDLKTLVLVRTATDSTVPEISILSPVARQIITNSYLPAIGGPVVDNESGIASVTMHLMRHSDGGFQYWNGRNWTVAATELPVSVDPTTARWSAPVEVGLGAYALPSGDLLVNGKYEVQITARNREQPAGTMMVSQVFTVDHHPVYVWTAGSFSDPDQNNNNHHWNNPENWSPYGVPGPEDIAVIESGAPEVAHSGAMTLHGLRLSGGTLTASNLFVRQLMVAGGRLSVLGKAQLADDGLFLWSGGELHGGTGGTGSFNNPLSGLTVVSNAVRKTLLGMTLNNSGTVLWLGGDIASDGGVINNGPTAVWEARGGASLNIASGFGAGRRAFVNYGRFKKTAADEVLHQGYFTNHGVLEVEVGVMSFQDSMNWEEGSRIVGRGKARGVNGCCGFTATVRGVTALDGMFELSEPNTVLTGTGAVVIGTNGVLAISNGFVSGSIGLSGPGNVLWTGGGFAGTNTVSTTMTVSGSGSKHFNRPENPGPAVLNNSGVIRWEGPGSIHGWARPAYGEHRGTIHNLPGATLHFAAGGVPFTQVGEECLLENHPGGLILKSGDTNETRLNAFAVLNQGEIRNEAGALTFDGRLDLNSNAVLTAKEPIRFHGRISVNDVVKTTGTIRMTGGSMEHARTTDGLARSRWVGPATFEFQGGTLGGRMVIGTNVHLSIGDPLGGTATKFLASSTRWDNYGRITWSGIGAIYAWARPAYSESPSVIVNWPGGAFEMLNDGTPFVRDGEHSIFTNHVGATILKRGGTNATVVNAFVVDNAGEIRAEVGHLEFNDSTLLRNGGRFTGSGSHLLSGGNHVIFGTNRIEDTTLRFDGGVVVGHVESGAALATSQAGVFEWAGGAISEKLAFTPGSTVRVLGAAAKTFSSGATLENHARVRWSGTGPVLNQARPAYGERPATWNNRSGAVLEAESDASFKADGVASTFNNEVGAQLRKIDGTTTNATVFDWVVNNSGLVSADVDRLEFAAGGTGTGTFATGPGARLRFTGGTYTLAGAQLQGDGRFQVDQATLAMAGKVVGDRASFDLLAGTVNGTGVFDGSLTFSWTGGWIGGTQSFSPGSMLQISGSAPKDIASGTMLNNAGRITWAGPGGLRTWARPAYSEFPSTINNLSGGSFELLTDGEPFGRLGEYSRFINSAGAVLLKRGGTGNAVISGIRLSNAGEVRVDSGTMEFNDAVEFDGGGVLSGSGIHLLSGGRHMVRGGTRLDAVFRVSGGSLEGEVGTAATLESGRGRLEWTGGALGGEVEFGASLLVLCDGAATKALAPAALIRNRGVWRWQGTGDIWSSARPAYGEPRAVIDNAPGAQFIVETDAGLKTSGLPNVFTNRPGALWIKTNSTGLTGIDWVVHNHGRMRIQSGVVALQANESLTEEGTVEVVLSGTKPGIDHGRLSLPGVNSLGGAFEVSLSGGFQPESGQSFAVVAYGSRTGRFTGIRFPGSSSGSRWQLDYEPTQVTVSLRQAHTTVQPVLTGDGQFQFDLVGPPGGRYVVEVSTNLVQWKGVWTNSPFNGSARFADIEARSIPGRFYRWRIEP